MPLILHVQLVTVRFEDAKRGSAVRVRTRIHRGGRDTCCRCRFSGRPKLTDSLVIEKNLEERASIVCLCVYALD